MYQFCSERCLPWRTKENVQKYRTKTNKANDIFFVELNMTSSAILNLNNMYFDSSMTYENIKMRQIIAKLIFYEFLNKRECFGNSEIRLPWKHFCKGNVKMKKILLIPLIWYPWENNSKGRHCSSVLPKTALKWIKLNQNGSSRSERLI